MCPERSVRLKRDALGERLYSIFFIRRCTTAGKTRKAKSCCVMRKKQRLSRTQYHWGRIPVVRSKHCNMKIQRPPPTYIKSINMQSSVHPSNKLMFSTLLPYFSLVIPRDNAELISHFNTEFPSISRSLLLFCGILSELFTLLLYQICVSSVF